MNASNLQKKMDFRNEVISSVGKFNRKHKKLTFLGIAYAAVIIAAYNFGFYFYRNSKRFICLASILLFFVASSSFSYPAMSMNISFAASTSDSEASPADTADLSLEEIAKSNAQLAGTGEVDEDVLLEAEDEVNPDAAEIENMVSVADILDSDQVSVQDSDYSETEGGETYEEEADETGSYIEQPEFSSDDWSIILVNKQHPIPDDYTFNLGTISGSMECDERIITPLVDMLKAARADGVNLIVCSPYRDIDRQTMLFSNKVNRYMGGGMSYMDAYNLASQAVTVPGSSEHQIGLAVDIITDGYATLDEGFGDTAAGKWLSENSYRYGFILRYPQGKEEITSIEYEPWHFRYVGVDAATVIKENGICLEEFWNIYVD